MPTQRALPFRQAKWYHAGRVATPRLIVIHFAVTPENDGAAEWLMNYGATTDRQASWHVACDRNSTTRSVNDWDTAWAAPGANADGYHAEQAGTTQTSAQWHDAYSLQMIREQTAAQVKDWSVRSNIPLTKLSPGQVANRNIRGICGHKDVTDANLDPSGSHTDPEPNFPWDVLLAAVGQHPTPIIRTVTRNPFPLPGGTFREGASGNQVRFVQWALGIPVDGTWGPQTTSAIRAFQTRNGLQVDGVAGLQTLAALARVTH